MPAWIGVLKDAVDRGISPEEFAEEHGMSVHEYIERAQNLAAYHAKIRGVSYEPMPHEVVMALITGDDSRLAPKRTLLVPRS